MVKFVPVNVIVLSLLLYVAAVIVVDGGVVSITIALLSLRFWLPGMDVTLKALPYVSVTALTTSKACDMLKSVLVSPLDGE